MTYLEAETYYDFYTKNENEKILIMFKLFAFYNLESTRMADHGSKNDVNSYIRNLRSENKEEKNIDDQFNEAGFEQ